MDHRSQGWLVRASTDARGRLSEEDRRLSLRVVILDDVARFRGTARRALAVDGVEMVAEVEDCDNAFAAVAQ